MSPLARSLHHLRELGHWPIKVEYWNHFARRRVDFIGVGDIYYADRKRRKLVLVQVLKAADDHGGAKHKKKIQASANAQDWKYCRGEIVLHVWYKPTKLRREWKLKEVRM